jgi:hypothetical protein
VWAEFQSDKLGLEGGERSDQPGGGDLATADGRRAEGRATGECRAHVALLPLRFFVVAWLNAAVIESSERTLEQEAAGESISGQEQARQMKRQWRGEIWGIGGSGRVLLCSALKRSEPKLRPPECPCWAGPGTVYFSFFSFFCIILENKIRFLEKLFKFKKKSNFEIFKFSNLFKSKIVQIINLFKSKNCSNFKFVKI